ncbi:hypothetical protein MNEG_5076 [Monoraphidium neglectum]|uniref:Uncharacterized protein n=1 Tax=Monoraphidium neglectum TaxID=145388 RepID=A0A0D2NBM5_9CHLO|nr:hypothetical protein MNEG_5076 [Monoraphidium neglectum]KIZ02881.1 hypothetical protein MNEG_5076 [Monoraphidium neglectum]|eukprot:XP_013901900.1 hypothetical protein MNEG_5076 [Monoraphidium neglectum]
MARFFVGLLALLALGCLVHQATAVDGGSFCKYVDRRKVQLRLRALFNGASGPPSLYFSTLNQLAKTNNWICKACGRGTDKVIAIPGNTTTTIDTLYPGFGQCFCEPGFGAWSYTIGRTSTTTPLVVANPGKTLQGIGCSKCPNGVRGPNTYNGSTIDTTVGPYNSATNTWTQTRCACRVTATGASC